MRQWPSRRREPVLPLAVALRSRLAETEAKLATAAPAEKTRSQAAISCDPVHKGGATKKRERQSYSTLTLKVCVRCVRRPRRGPHSRSPATGIFYLNAITIPSEEADCGKRRHGWLGHDAPNLKLALVYFARHAARYCQLSGPRAPFSSLARLEPGSRIGEQGLVNLNNQSKKSGRN